MIRYLLSFELAPERLLTEAEQNEIAGAIVEAIGKERKIPFFLPEGDQYLIKFWLHQVEQPETNPAQQDKPVHRRRTNKGENHD